VVVLTQLQLQLELVVLAEVDEVLQMTDINKANLVLKIVVAALAAVQLAELNNHQKAAAQV